MDSAILPPRDRRLALGIFAFTLFSYAYFFGGGGWGQNANFGIVRAVVERGTVRLDAYRDTTGDVVIRDGHVYSNKPPGLAMAAIPPYALLVALENMSGLDPSDPLLLTLNAYVCNFFTCALLGALVPTLLFVYARSELELTAAVALAGALAISFGTQLFPYATLFLVHTPTAALLFVAYELARRPSHSAAAGAGVAVSLAAAMNYVALPAVAVIGSIVLIRHRRTLGTFVLAAIPITILFAIYQKLSYGAVFRLGGSMNEQFTTKGAWLGMIVVPSADAIWGVTLSRFKGLFYVAPVLLLAFVGAYMMARKKRWLELFACSAISLLFFLVNISFNNWDGGFGIGMRYLVPIIPFLGVMILHAIDRVPRAIVIVLVVISIANNFAATAVDPQPSGSLSDPLGEYIYPALIAGEFTPRGPYHPRWAPRLMSGHVGLVRHTFDQYVPFAKHPPGSPPSEWASFNLGETLFSTGDPRSLIPFAIVAAIACVFLLRLARQRDGEAA